MKHNEHSLFGAKIKTLNLIQNPSGTWGFVGSVPATLAFIGKDGSAPTEEQIKTAIGFGIRFSGLKTRSWATAEEALASAEEAGHTVKGH